MVGGDTSPSTNVGSWLTFTRWFNISTNVPEASAFFMADTTIHITALAITSLLLSSNFLVTRVSLDLAAAEYVCFEISDLFFLHNLLSVRTGQCLCTVGCPTIDAKFDLCLTLFVSVVTQTDWTNLVFLGIGEWRGYMVLITVALVTYRNIEIFFKYNTVWRHK